MMISNRQGSLTPHSTFWVDRVLMAKGVGIKFGTRSHKVNNLKSAEETDLLDTENNSQQGQISVLHTTGKQFRLHISVNKMMVMVFCRKKEREHSGLKVCSSKKYRETITSLVYPGSFSV